MREGEGDGREVEAHLERAALALPLEVAAVPKSRSLSSTSPGRDPCAAPLPQAGGRVPGVVGVQNPPGARAGTSS